MGTKRFLDNKLVFLAGATGLAGTAIIRHILSHYPKTRLRAAYYRHTKPFIRDKRIKYIFGDLRSEKDCRRIVKGCDCAIMAAAHTGGAGIAVREPWLQVDDNVIMNVRLLSAFHKEKIGRIVYIGSATLYQEFVGHIKEDQLDLNQDPYSAYIGIGWVMRFIEKLCAFWHKKTGMEIIIARSANIFGPFAKFNPLTSNFIPAIIRKAVFKQDPFEVWGNPDVARDVIYAEDFARAIVMLIDNEKIKFDVFNIGSGVKTRVGDVLSWALKSANHKPKEIKYLSDKPTTIKSRLLDCSKAHDILGWKPHYTVREGVEKTTKWWMENKEWWKK